MEIVANEERLDASPAYVRPGGPYAGPRLPKDISVLVGLASSLGLGSSTPLLASIEVSNELHWIRYEHAANEEEHPAETFQPGDVIVRELRILGMIGAGTTVWWASAFACFAWGDASPAVSATTIAGLTTLVGGPVAMTTFRASSAWMSGLPGWRCCGHWP